MNAMEPKKKESQVGTPNTRISTPVATPVTIAFVGNAIASLRGRQGLGLKGKALFRNGLLHCACSICTWSVARPRGEEGIKEVILTSQTRGTGKIHL